MNKTILFAALIAITLAGTTKADAGFFDFLFKKKEVKVEINPSFPIDEASFAENTASYHDVPFNNPKYEFDIKIPKTWKSEPVANTTDQTQTSNGDAINSEVPTDLAIFSSPFLNTAKITIKIEYINLKREISLENWLTRHAKLNGYPVQEGIKKLADNKLNISFFNVTNTSSSYTNITAQKNKDVVLLLRIDMPSSIQEDMDFLQQKIVESFRLIMKMSDTVEPQDMVTLADAVKIRYPNSWKLYAGSQRDVNRMYMQINNVVNTVGSRGEAAKKINGVVELFAIKRRAETSLEKEIDNLKQEIGNNLQINFTELVSSDKADTNPRFIFSRYEVYKTAMIDGAKLGQDIHVAILGDEKWYVLAYLYTPAKDADFYNWANNVESFRIILKGLL